ncbi:MAG: DUF4258 domain-containing protein [Anaerolineales bacterium]|nr:DUF4258 domain-containing protein [Anaerolineales bacterium]
MAKRYRYHNDPGNEQSYEHSKHAKLRMAQRNVSKNNIEFVLENGQWFHRGGAIFVFLGSRDIQKSREFEKKFERLEGTVVVLSRDGSHIITVYRNRQQGLRKIKQKDCYGRNPICYKNIWVLNKIVV